MSTLSYTEFTGVFLVSISGVIIVFFSAHMSYHNEDYRNFGIVQACTLIIERERHEIVEHMFDVIHLPHFMVCKVEQPKNNCNYRPALFFCLLSMYLLYRTLQLKLVLLPTA